MNRREFIKGALLATGTLVIGVDLASGKDVTKSIQVVTDYKGTAWVSKTSDEILDDIKSLSFWNNLP
jgi:hypothetical protein